MLRKVVSIKNVGRFLSCGAGGDVSFKRYNLVFAENGRGKTTLCAILRSLQSGDPAHVIGRTTLGNPGIPEISILFEGDRPAALNAGAWNTTIPNLTIFDSTFVSENVYSGDAVELSHRRNLYGVIVGAQGVALAQQIERYDAASREKSTEIRGKRAVVQATVPQGLTVEEFLPLQEDPEIDVKIAEKHKEFEAVQQAEKIRTRPALSELNVPKFWAAFRGLIGKTIEDIAEDARHRINSQIKAHAMHEREQWLSEGLGYIHNNECPFCGQSISGVALIDTYRAYFSEAYYSLRDEIATMYQQIADAFSDRVIGSIERIIDHNNAGVEFWSRYCTITPPTLDVNISETVFNLRNSALPLLERKAAMPLESVAPDALFIAALDAHLVAQKSAETYNQAVRAANAIITQKKAATAAADARAVQKNLILLQVTKKRHEPIVKRACEEYENAQGEKKTLEDRKVQAKAQLDAHTQDLIGRYEQTINRLLDDFHAGFRITGTSHGYPGGLASASYQILINETAVELGDAGSSLTSPSFKNTLSSGDRSTLALAFFLAQLEHDPDKASKIVIFDDPFNSQDSFRKDCTVQKIKKCGDDCRQVVVLSHDQSFLKRIWDRLASRAADRKCLQLKRVGLRDTKICPWDIEEATQARYVADLKALTDYYNAAIGNPRDIVNKIRPIIETYCRNLYPADFGNDMLGTIIGKIRVAGAAHQLFPLLNDLDALNDYTSRYHHGENPNAITEPISDGELQGFVKKTLTITGCC